nr:hypothetical protein [uncultured Desulfobacter sp.]
MSINDDLRKIYNLSDDVPDWEVSDIVARVEDRENRIKNEEYVLKRGRVVHKIWLTQHTPARAVKAEFNKVLDCDVDLRGFNELDDPDHKNPGSWFVREGFKVRSKKQGSYWVQYAHSTYGPENLTMSDIEEYMEFSGLDSDSDSVVMDDV